jgi:hypothetical protein
LSLLRYFFNRAANRTIHHITDTLR